MQKKLIKNLKVCADQLIRLSVTKELLICLILLCFKSQISVKLFNFLIALSLA